MRTQPLPDRLDGLFFSCDLGVAKPDPGFFRAIVDTLRVDPARMLFVDDVVANVHAARSVGLAAEHKPLAAGAGALRDILLGYGLNV